MLKNKLNLKIKGDMKKRIKEKGDGKKDTRFLNYYDLKKDEKVKVLFIPDKNGNLFSEYKLHGPNLKVRGAGAIRCSNESSNEECPACQKGYGLLDESKETGDDAYKDEAKRWFARDYTIMSCLVLETPFEVLESPDKNEVKLISVPYAVVNKIEQAILEGEIEQDDIPNIPFFIKKTEKAGGYAEYTNSYFARNPISDDELEYFDDLVVEQYDFDDPTITPVPTSTEEVEEWMVKAEKVVNKAANKADEEEEEESTTKSAVKSKVQKTLNKAKADEPEDDEDGDTSDGAGDPEPEEEEPEEPVVEKKKSGVGSLRDRLNRTK